MNTFFRNKVNCFKKILWVDFFRDIGLLLFFIPIQIFFITCFYFILKCNINDFIAPFAMGGSFLLTIFLSNRKTNRVIHFSLVLVACLVIVSTFYALNTFFYDISFDGQWYHQDAMIFIKHLQWNPYYDPYLKDDIVSGGNASWLNHYSKAAWFVFASTYEFFEKIQIAKSVNGIFMISAFFLTLSFLLTNFSFQPFISFLLSFLLSTSPVSFGQIFTYYIDGQVSSLLLIFVLFGIEYLKHPPNIRAFLPVIFAFTYFINLKFNAAIYGFVLLAIGFLWQLLSASRIKNLIKPAIWYILMSSVAVFFFGYPTYVRNTLEKKHPFYPLLGDNKNTGEKLAQVSYPMDFFQMNRFEKYIRSTFAIPQYTSSNTHPSVAKSLFTFKHIRYYMDHFYHFQPVLMSPLGPLYGEFVVLFIPLLVFVAWLYRKLVLFWFLFLSCLLTMVIMPEFWIYRYTPQLYYLFIIVLLFALSSQIKIVRYYGFIVILGLLINICLANYCGLIYNIRGSLEVRREISELKGKKIIVQPGWMRSFEFRLKESKIDYTIANGSEPVDSFVSFRTEYSTNWKYTVLPDGL